MAESNTIQTSSIQQIEEKASGRSIATFVIGICSWFNFGLILGIVAIVLGIMERNAIASGQSSPKGDSFVLTGLIMGIASVIINILAIIFAFLLISIALGIYLIQTFFK